MQRLFHNPATRPVPAPAANLTLPSPERMIHPFRSDISHIPLPRLFTYPFCYTPHLLCLAAAEEVKAYLAARADWQEELAGGKMFGVLAVQQADGRVGYLAAFSGILAGKSRHSFFVPPVYDLQDPAGFFPRLEASLDRLTALIRSREEDPAARARQAEEQRLRAEAEASLARAREALKEGKARRDALRLTAPGPAVLEALVRESQHAKAEFRRLRKQWEARLSDARQACARDEQALFLLRAERHRRSAAAQRRIFRHFRLRNALGETEDLCQIFAATPQRVPPAGSGECAAPKLLQYAFLHRLRPLAMAEFWWGRSPRDTLRRHGSYYPACTEKCGPILRFMLRGLPVEPDPLAEDPHRGAELPVVYEDEWLVAVCKPAGLLSVPGKKAVSSALALLRGRYPGATGPLLVHRLDMDTSGILLAAKTKEVHQNLQAQFKNRTVEKAYVALLDGEIAQNEGLISLPLRLDPADRPRRIVDPLHGKPALTHFRVVGRSPGQTRVLFFPRTGRTHQLRVHAAHPDGLDTPILGDRLYGGTPAAHLYLHAASLRFRHPASGQVLHIECPPPF